MENFLSVVIILVNNTSAREIVFWCPFLMDQVNLIVCQNMERTQIMKEQKRIDRCVFPTWVGIVASKYIYVFFLFLPPWPGV